jgi:RNA polymerase primary sigma factor
MASNIKAPPGRNMRGASQTRGMSLPLLDFSDAAVKELIDSAKTRGHVTVDQINAVLPSKEANSEQIKDILSIFGEMGVNVVETKEAEPEEELAKRGAGGGSRGRERASRSPATTGSGQVRGQGSRWAHRRPRAHVSPRNELGGTPFA